MTERLPVAEQIFGHNRPPVEEVLAADYKGLIGKVDDMLGRAARMPRKVRTDEQVTLVGNAIADMRALANEIDEARKREGKPLFDAKKSLDTWFKDLAGRIEERRSELQKAADEHARAKAAEERARREREAEAARKRAEEAERKASGAKRAGTAARYEGAAEAAAVEAEEKAREAGAGHADLVRSRAGGVTASARASWTFRIDDYSALQATLGPLGPFLAREDVEKAIRSIVRIQKGNTDLPGVAVFEDVKATFRK